MKDEAQDLASLRQTVTEVAPPPKVAVVLQRFRNALVDAGLEPYEFRLTWEPPVAQRLHRGDHEPFGACVLRINSDQSVEMLCRKLIGEE